MGSTSRGHEAYASAVSMVMIRDVSAFQFEPDEEHSA
jgi:hypothetical protein